MMKEELRKNVKKEGTCAEKRDQRPPGSPIEEIESG